MPLIRARSANAGFISSVHKGSSYSAAPSAPSDLCYLLTRSNEANNVGNLGNSVEKPITAACSTVPDPNVTPEERNANARQVPNGSGDGRIWRSHIRTRWSKTWFNTDTDFIKPADVRTGLIHGVTSGVSTTLTDMSRNTALSTTFPSCFIIDFEPAITLQLTSGGSAVFERTQWMTIQTWGTAQGNAAADDVRFLNYEEWLYSETSIGVDSIDWATSGYFLPGEECYFEGCPAPVILSAKVITYNPAAGGSRGRSTAPCFNFIPTDNVPSPVPGDDTTYGAGNTGYWLKVDMVFEFTLSAPVTSLTTTELAQLQKVWTGATSGGQIDLSTIALTNNTTTCQRSIDHGGNAACFGLPARYRVIEVRGMTVNGSDPTKVTAFAAWGNDDNVSSSLCTETFGGFPTFTVGEDLI